MADPRSNAFDECFDRVLAGESLEQVLGDFPTWAAEFRPLLEAAQAALLLRSDPDPEAAMARSRDRFLSEARNLTIPHNILAPDTYVPRGEFPVSSQRSPSRQRPAPTPKPRRKTGLFGLSPLRFGLTAALVVLGLLVGSISTVAVSAQTLPGDALYPIKLITERTRLLFTKDPGSRYELEKIFDQRRAQEVNDLILRDRSATVNFAGGLEALGPNEWLVEDIRVLVVPGTHVIGELVPGTYVNVQGTLQTDGAVLATRIWTREFEFTGELHQIFPDRWQVDGLIILVDAQTLAGGVPPVGSVVKVLVVQLSGGDLRARSVQIITLPPATATLTPTATQQPSATVEFRPSRTPRPSETKKPNDSGDNETPEGEDNEEPSKTPKPTDDDDDDDDDEEHETPKPTKTRRPTRTPEPTEHDDDDDEEDNATPQVTATLTPTATPGASPEPTDDD